MCTDGESFLLKSFGESVVNSTRKPLPSVARIPEPIAPGASTKDANSEIANLLRKRSNVSKKTSAQRKPSLLTGLGVHDSSLNLGQTSLLGGRPKA